MPGTECTQGEASEDHCWDQEGSGKDAGVGGNAQVQSKAQANSCKERKSRQTSQSFLLSFMSARCCHQPNHQPQTAQGREQASLSANPKTEDAPGLPMEAYLSAQDSTIMCIMSLRAPGMIYIEGCASYVPRIKMVP